MAKVMPPHAAGKGPEELHADTVDDLLSLLRSVADTESFKSLRSDIQENATLREKVAKLESAFDLTTATVGKKQAEMKEASARHEQQLTSQTTLLKEEIERSTKAREELAEEKASSAAKEAKLEAQKKRIKDLIDETKAKGLRIAELEKIENMKNGLEERLTGSEDALKRKSEQLAQASHSLELVRSLVFHLETLQSNKDKICGVLECIFNDAFQLIGSWLQGDFDESRLSNVEGWERLRDHSSTNRALPLVPSNSASAKAMRIAAGLSVYAKALAKHVMRPTYILRDDESLDALNKLARHKPEQGAYARAVLLKSFPDLQQSAKEKQTSLAVQDVVATLGWCVSSKDKEQLQSSVEKVTAKIADSWALIQRLEEAIKPSFRMDFAEDWRPLPAQSVGVTKATTSSSQRNKQQDKQNQAGPQEQTESASVTLPVFPAFIYIDSKQAMDNLLCAGYGVTEIQIGKAREEFSRRAQRKAARQTGSAPRQRRDSGLFQPASGSNGLTNE